MLPSQMRHRWCGFRPRSPTSHAPCVMAESLIVSAPATSANLGPGFDVLAAALDLTNAVVITRRPGPLVVRVTGEGAGDLPEDASNLVCRALRAGLESLDG